MGDVGDGEESRGRDIDELLAGLFRSSSLGLTFCGVSALAATPGIRNEELAIKFFLLLNIPLPT